MFKEINNLGPLLNEPQREFNVRELARILKITPATASKKLKEFTKKDLLSYRKERTFDLYKANLESECLRDLKVYHSITKIRQSGLIESFNQFYLKPTIVLFGSSATGYDTKESDLDLLIISPNQKEFPLKNKYEKKLKKDIQLFIVKNIKGLPNKHLINSVLNGIVLQGALTWT